VKREISFFHNEFDKRICTKKNFTLQVLQHMQTHFQSKQPLSRAILKEGLRCLGHVVWMKDDRLPKIVLSGQPSRAKRKAGRPRLGWEDVIKNV
jgi:hypothetical protein